MDNSKYLAPGHPSYGFEQAWFMFAVLSPSGQGFRKLLLVEAKNAAAVAAIERIVATDGRVSGTCELMAVHRQCPSIGVRSGMADEVPYPDFMVDMVDPERYARDGLAMDAFQASLTPEERAAAIDRLSAEPSGTGRAPVLAPAPGAMEDVEAALHGLGFTRQQIRRMVDLAGPGTASMPLGTAIKACLQGAQQ